MDIKWSYILIAVIYVLVILLRVANMATTNAYKKKHSKHKVAFSVKKDFFTTVSMACIVATLGINMAAVFGGRPINTSSIIITVLVIGFTIINSFYSICFSEEAETISWIGYEIKAGEIESLKVKEGRYRTVVNMTFTKEIDSYNYAKVLVFGKNQRSLSNILGKLVKKQEA